MASKVCNSRVLSVLRWLQVQAVTFPKYPSSIMMVMCAGLFITLVPLTKATDNNMIPNFMKILCMNFSAGNTLRVLISSVNLNTAPVSLENQFLLGSSRSGGQQAPSLLIARRPPVSHRRWHLVVSPCTWWREIPTLNNCGCPCDAVMLGHVSLLSFVVATLARSRPLPHCCLVL